MLFQILFYVLVFTSAFATPPVKKKNTSYPPISLSDLPALRVPFYEISKSGEKAYLLGTFHYGVEYQTLPSYVKRISQVQAATVVIEADLFKGNQVSAANLQSNPFDLKKALTEKEWQTLRQATAPMLGANLAMLEILDPASASAIYTMSFLPQTKEPMDAMIMAHAARTGKRLIFLEEVEFQRKLIAELLTIEVLKEQLKVPLADIKRETLMLLNAYKSGDLKQLEAIVLADAKRNKIEDRMYKRLMDDRNDNWIAKFDDIFKNDGIEFIAVGAAHLIGEKGLIKQLKDRGYTVVPYNENAQDLKRKISSQ